MSKLFFYISCMFLIMCFSNCSSKDVNALPSGSVGSLIVETPDENFEEPTEEEKVFAIQEKEKDRQRKDLEDLDRQRYYNEKIEKYGLE